MSADAELVYIQNKFIPTKIAFHPQNVISKARSFWKMTNLFKPIVALPSSHKHRQLGLHVFSGNVLDRKMIPDHPNHFKAAGEDTTHPATVIYEVRVDSFQRTLETSSRVPCGVGVISIPLSATRAGDIVLYKRAYE